MRSTLWILPFLLFLGACAPLEYQAAKLDTTPEERVLDGYVSKEISEGVHVIEVRHENRIAFLVQKEQTLNNMKDIWKRRASELCPKGFQGEPEVIRPDEARTDEFYCTLKVCQPYLMVSGIAYCKTVYEF